MKTTGPILLSIVLLSCAKDPPERTLAKVQKLLRSEDKVKACDTLDDMDTGKVRRWPSQTVYTYLRLKALCVHQRGRKHARTSLPEPYRAYYRAMLSVGAGESLDTAAGILRDALKAHPREAELYYRLGLFHLLDERFAEACPLIRKAVELGRASTDGYRLSLARCLLGQGHLKAIPGILAPLVYDGVKGKDLAQARHIMENARLFKRLMPKDVRGVILAVKGFLAKGNAGKAMDMLVEQVQANPQYPILHYLLGVVHLRLGNKADAVVQLRQCLKLDATDPDAWFLLARLYMGSSMASRSEGYLKKALGFDPLSSKIRASLRDYYIKTGAFSRAADLHKSVIWLTGEKRSVNQAKLLGGLLEKAERSDEALKVWGKILRKLGPDDGIEAVRALARIHYKLSVTGASRTVYHRRQAAKLVKTGLKLRPMDEELIALGKVLGVKHEVAKAPFEDKIRVKGAKHVNKDDILFK